MSIIINNDNNRERRKNTSFTLSYGSGLFIITSIILAVGGFALIGSTATTLMTNAAFAQEGSDNGTTATSADNSAAATTTSNTSSGTQLSPQPIWQERQQL